jgi:hypothetical protein
MCWQVKSSVLLCHQVRGSLGANTVSSIAAGAGIIILILNLSYSSAYINQCEDVSEDDSCFVASFTIVCISCEKAMLLI